MYRGFVFENSLYAYKLYNQQQIKKEAEEKQDHKTLHKKHTSL